MAHQSIFNAAVSKLASLAQAVCISENGASIAAFKAQCSAVLNRTDTGSIEVITRGDRRYVILSESHVIALAQKVRPGPFAGDLLSDLPLLSAGGDVPRSRRPGGPLVRFGRLPDAGEHSE